LVALVIVVTVSGNNVYVVWGDEDGGILYRKSTDGGATFGSTVNLSNNVGLSNQGGSSEQPDMAVSGNNVYVVWTGTDSATGITEILLRKSVNAGTMFGSIVNLTRSWRYGNAKEGTREQS
jgi:hypothetical protein